MLIRGWMDDLTKIIIVVDSYDAMTSKRNYRKNMSMEQAVEELYRCSGTQFEQNIVEFFSRIIIDFTPTKSVFSEEYLEKAFVKITK